MNTYYSNLIEGHNTRPRDIERALGAQGTKGSAISSRKPSPTIACRNISTGRRPRFYADASPEMLTYARAINPS